jgi:hypothetical protein
MARMGVFLERDVRQVYPDFPVQHRVSSWEDYLPPLNAELVKLVEQHSFGMQAAGKN